MGVTTYCSEIIFTVVKDREINSSKKKVSDVKNYKQVFAMQ